MSDKLTLDDLGNLQNETSAVNTINNNNQAICDAFDNTLSRDGSTPNTMEADLDMNSQRILNLPTPTTGGEPIPWSLGEGIVDDSEAAQAAAEAAAAAAAISETNAASSASGANTSASNAAISEANAATSETNAATSAANAATSETNAGTSETNAAASAAAALISEGNAATSETNAAASAAAALISEGNAATSEANAATSETNAATSEANAATSETNAAASEAAAAASAALGEVKISANDTTGATLDTKLVAGTNITLVENNDGGNETLTINSTAAGGDLLAANNLSDVANASTSLTNLGGQPVDVILTDLSGLTLAQGDILYYDGTNLNNLAPGVSGQFLKTQGAAANPIWDTAGGGGDLLAANNLSDLANAATARTNLGVDAAGTDNSTDVTLAGALDYLTIVGQAITRNAIDLTTDITGSLPVANGGTGATTAAGARTNLGVDAAGTDNSTDVTLAGTPNYLTLSGQQITLGTIDVADLSIGTDGELVTWDASGNPATVAVGTAGQVLTSNGAGAAPTFQTPAGGGGNPGLVLLGVANMGAGVATVDLTSIIDGTYDDYKIFVSGTRSLTNSVRFEMQLSTDNGSSWITTNYRQTLTDTTDAGTVTQAGGTFGTIRLTPPNVTNSTTLGTLASEITLYGLNNTSNYTTFSWSSTHLTSGTVGIATRGSGVWQANTAVNAVRLRMNSGSMAEGIVRIYGLDKTV